MDAEIESSVRDSVMESDAERLELRFEALPFDASSDEEESSVRELVRESTRKKGRMSAGECVSAYDVSPIHLR